VIAGALRVPVGGGRLAHSTRRPGLAAFADALEWAFRVMVGIAVLQVVAALIQGLFSPYYWRPFLVG